VPEACSLPGWLTVPIEWNTLDWALIKIFLRARPKIWGKFKYLLFSENSMGLDEKIVDLDKKTKQQVAESLKSINIALKLNSAKVKSTKVPKNLQKLMVWKQELESWQGNYGGANDVMLMAEGLGAFNEICTRLG